MLTQTVKRYKDKGFNLNLLECKCIIPFACDKVIAVLISTYWNVNSQELIEKQTQELVLILTYWNVNVDSFFLENHQMTVLISTYWNVNF